ncbi:hypothetical protein FMM74_002505 [Lachnospiraceae bacterium MD308]|nr:hypothetical protein [Lachnospiraceae bacterium MD308]
MEQSQKRKKKKVYTKQITALVFLGVLIILCLFNLILGNKKAVKPRITPKSLLDGSYMEDYGNYFTERFWGRGAFKGLNFSVQTMFGKRESEGIYKGNKKYLLEEIAAPDERAMEENIRKIQELAGTYYQIPVYVMLAPNAAYIQPEKLPAYAVGRDQKKQFDDIKEKLGAGINWIEVSKALLKHSDEELYYRTDNNWTSLGAFYGYEALAAAMGLDTSRAPELTPYVVNNDFIGSLAKKSGYGKGYEDSVTIYAPKNIKDSVKILMTDMDTGKKYATLYDSAKLEKEDKYSLFLGGNAGMLDIKTTADTTDRLLIFKDSYANCLIPFLAPYYREIVAVDASIYEGNIQEIMQKAKFTSILFLYNGNSFVTDTYLSKVLSLPAASGTQEEEAGGAPGTQDNNTDEVSETQDNSTDGEDMEVQDTENTDLQDGETNDETE